MKFNSGDRIVVKGKEYEVKSIRIEDYEFLKKYYMMRRPETSDSNIFDLYLWQSAYDTRYICGETGLIFFSLGDNGRYYSTIPLCKKENLKEWFEILKDLHNDILGQKLNVVVCDKEALEELRLNEEIYDIARQREYDDYIYDAEKLRTLSGKKYHKKKNHLNAFLRENEGRYEFRELSCVNRQELLDFLSEWIDDKDDEEKREYIDYEAEGVKYILDYCNILEFKVAGVYIDEKLQAFTIGCYIEEDDMVYVPVEKANASVRGLYNYISSEFLKRLFPDVSKVNREDDMGLEGLRKSKLSYNPIYLVEKYRITEK